MSLSAEHQTFHGRWRGVARSAVDELLVSEIFGPTIQGEGPSAGRSAVFVRLGMCNLQCSWCDTKYTWDNAQFDLDSELKSLSHRTVADAVDAVDVPLLVITGGEPALQAAGCRAMIDNLSVQKSVEIETNGTVWPDALVDAVDRMVVSPKLANSAVKESARLRWPILKRLAGLDHSVFKFVVTNPGELAEIADLVEQLALDSPRVWIMPEATTRKSLHDRLNRLVDPVSQRGWNLSSRLHIDLWEGARGR